MKTNLAGPSPIEQFISKLKDSGIDIDSTRFQTFTITFRRGGSLLTQAYLFDGGYRLLLADTRGWLLNPDADGLHPSQLIDGDIKLLPESEMDKSVEYIRQRFVQSKRPTE